MSAPNFKSWYPVFGIRSYDEAIDYYVNWLGFNLDWEWREAPGQPAIVSISREGIGIGLNESPMAQTGAWLVVHVNNAQALADEWNGRRPGSAQVRSGVPYEGSVISLVDPFGNRIEIQQMLTKEQNEAVRKERVPKMRQFVQQQLASGKPVPTPDEIVAAIGPSRGLAIEVLNEFPQYAETFQARREASRKVLEIEVVELAAQPALVMEREAALEELAANVADVLPKVQAHLTGHDASPAGPPFMRFIDVTQTFTVAIGMPTSAAVEPGSDMQLIELPPCKAVTALHTGSEGGLRKAWGAVLEHAADRGHQHAGAWGGIGGWVVYLNDPAVVGLDQAQTRLYLPLED